MPPFPWLGLLKERRQIAAMDLDPVAMAAPSLPLAASPPPQLQPRDDEERGALECTDPASPDRCSAGRDSNAAPPPSPPRSPLPAAPQPSPQQPTGEDAAASREVEQVQEQDEEVVPGAGEALRSLMKDFGDEREMALVLSPRLKEIATPDRAAALRFLGEKYNSLMERYRQQVTKCAHECVSRYEYDGLKKKYTDECVERKRLYNEIIEHGPACKQLDPAESLKFKQMSKKQWHDEKENTPVNQSLQLIQAKYMSRENKFRTLNEKLRKDPDRHHYDQELDCSSRDLKSRDCDHSGRDRDRSRWSKHGHSSHGGDQRDRDHSRWSKHGHSSHGGDQSKREPDCSGRGRDRSSSGKSSRSHQGQVFLRRSRSRSSSRKRSPHDQKIPPIVPHCSPHRRTPWPSRSSQYAEEIPPMDPYYSPHSRSPRPRYFLSPKKFGAPLSRGTTGHPHIQLFP